MNRSEVLRRARTIWPMGQVPYSQGQLHQPDGYRADCSGYVAACWGTPPNGAGSWGGFSTVTVGYYAHQITPDELRPGDAIGRCGPGTAGNDGHIQLFLGWDNATPGDNGHRVLEQAGGSSGPTERHYATWPDGYTCWRLNGIVEDTTPAPAPAPRVAPPWPLPRNEYFGLVTGPAASHGGYYPNEQPYVRAIQQALIRKGYVPGVSDPGSPWADGIYEQATADAVARFQRAQMPGTTYFGQVWWDDWARLLG